MTSSSSYKFIHIFSAFATRSLSLIFYTFFVSKPNGRFCPFQQHLVAPLFYNWPHFGAPLHSRSYNHLYLVATIEGPSLIYIITCTSVLKISLYFNFIKILLNHVTFLYKSTVYMKRKMKFFICIRVYLYSYSRRHDYLLLIYSDIYEYILLVHFLIAYDELINSIPINYHSANNIANDLYSLNYSIFFVDECWIQWK